MSGLKKFLSKFGLVGLSIKAAASKKQTNINAQIFLSNATFFLSSTLAFYFDTFIIFGMC